MKVKKRTFIVLSVIVVLLVGVSIYLTFAFMDKKARQEDKEAMESVERDIRQLATLLPDRGITWEQVSTSCRKSSSKLIEDQVYCNVNVTGKKILQNKEELLIVTELVEPMKAVLKDQGRFSLKESRSIHPKSFPDTAEDGFLVFGYDHVYVDRGVHCALKFITDSQDFPKQLDVIFSCSKDTFTNYYPFYNSLAE